MHWRAAYVQPASCWKTTVRSLVISLAGNAALAEGLHGTLRCCLAVLADNNSLEMLVSQYGPLQSSHCYGCWMSCQGIGIWFGTEEHIVHKTAE